jgi:hypothetical protein
MVFLAFSTQQSASHDHGRELEPFLLDAALEGHLQLSTAGNQYRLMTKLGAAG